MSTMPYDKSGIIWMMSSTVGSSAGAMMLCETQCRLISVDKDSKKYTTPTSLEVIRAEAFSVLSFGVELSNAEGSRFENGQESSFPSGAKVYQGDDMGCCLLDDHYNRDRIFDARGFAVRETIYCRIPRITGKRSSSRILQAVEAALPFFPSCL